MLPKSNIHLFNNCKITNKIQNLQYHKEVVFKNNIIMTVAEIKEKYRKELFEVAGTMTANNKMQVAINMGIAFLTVERYTSGKEENVRNAETAEKILNECKKVMQNQPA